MWNTKREPAKEYGTNLKFSYVIVIPNIQVKIVSSILAEPFVLIITFIFAVNVRVTIVSLNTFVRFYNLGENFEICFQTQIISKHKHQRNWL